MMKQLTTKTDLINELNAVNGLRRAVIETQTTVRMNKKDVETKQIANPFAEVFKCQKIVVELNTDYEETVNILRLTEGKADDFKAEGLSWGKAVNGIVIEKDGNMYVKTVELEKDGNAIYMTADGTIVDYDQLRPFIPKYNGSIKQGLQDDVKVRTFKIDSILSMTIPGVLEYNKQ